MAALTGPLANVKGLDCDAEIAREGKSATNIWPSSLIMSDVNGYIVPNSTSAGVFSGTSSGMYQNFRTGAPNFDGAAQSDRSLAQRPRGIYYAQGLGGGVSRASIGAPIYASTDSPADLSLTYTANAKVIGFVIALEKDPNQLSPGFVAGSAFIYYDARCLHGVGQNISLAVYAGTINTRSGVTIASGIYQCPPNRQAVVLDAQITAQIANANYATSATFDFSKVVGTTRTSLLGSTVNVNTGGALTADTPFALTGAATPFATLSNGDRLEGKIGTVGSETTPGNILIAARILEYGYAN